MTIAWSIARRYNGLHKVFPTSGGFGDIAQVARLDDKARVLVIVRAKSSFIRTIVIPFAKEGVAIDGAIGSAYKAQPKIGVIVVVITRKLKLILPRVVIIVQRILQVDSTYRHILVHFMPLSPCVEI